MRREFTVNGVYLEGEPWISIFHYDNDSFVLYQYVDRDTIDTEVLVHVKDAVSLTEVTSKEVLLPLYQDADEAVFRVRTRVGKWNGYRVNRTELPK